MTLIAEKIAVIAREYLETRNINDSHDFLEPIFQTKIKEFGWDLTFAASSIVCEIVWKAAVRGGGATEWSHINRLFSPSPIATHANFRGSAHFKTGNCPEVGSIVIWKKGNGWQGHMAIVVWVSEDKKTFNVIQGKGMKGTGQFILALQEKKELTALSEFKQDRLNILGFIYPPDREIN